MIASELLSYVNGFSVAQYAGLEDFSDRANFQGNIIVLLICMLIVSMRQYFMNPIICYISSVPGGSNAEDYITNMCWVEGTVPLNFSAKVPHKLEDWKLLQQDRMNYYQWIPFVLSLQAVLYYLPKLFWQIITYNRIGMDLEQLVKDANDANSEDDETRRKIIEHISRNIEIMLYGHRKIKTLKETVGNRIFRHVPGKRNGNLLVSYYFLIKIAYISVGFIQLLIMFHFLKLSRKEGYQLFGHRILRNILSGKDWTETQVFPRVGMCRNALEQMGNTNNAVAQCLLPINMLNEKIYIFLYFFLSSVLFITIMSLPIWIYRVTCRKTQKHVVKQCLKMTDFLVEFDQYTKRKIDRFVVEFLRQDGNFIIRMLSMNVGDLTTSSVVCRLFEIYSTEGYAEIDLRNRIKRIENEEYQSECGSSTFMKIPLKNKGVALKTSNRPTAPQVELELL
uniref:Innexin n=1 Tax=Schmidtea mediterranea TaxID=79327 RepID=H9CXU2_SCHMD|nr:INX-13 [Schmidtea mediterranea]